MHSKNDAIHIIYGPMKSSTNISLILTDFMFSRLLSLYLLFPFRFSVLYVSLQNIFHPQKNKKRKTKATATKHQRMNYAPHLIKIERLLFFIKDKTKLHVLVRQMNSRLQYNIFNRQWRPIVITEGHKNFSFKKSTKKNKRKKKIMRTISLIASHICWALLNSDEMCQLHTI